MKKVKLQKKELFSDHENPLPIIWFLSTFELVCENDNINEDKAICVL